MIFPCHPFFILRLVLRLLFFYLIHAQDAYALSIYNEQTINAQNFKTSYNQFFYEKKKDKKLTIRAPSQQRRQRTQLILTKPQRILMPRILMRLLEIARALAHCGGHWYRIVRVFCKDVR